MSTDVIVLLAILGFALLTMGIYGATGAARRADPLESSDRGSFVLGGFVRGWFYWFVQPVLKVSLALRLSPLVYNLLGVLWGALAGLFFALDRVNLAGWAVLLGGAADVMDGRVARAQGVASPRGAFLDSTLDRFAEFGAFVGLAAFFNASTPALVLVSLALGGSLLVSYTRARGESQGVVCKVGIMQRAERLLLLGFGALFDAPLSAALGRDPGTVLLWITAIIAVGTVGTAVYRTIWIARRLPHPGA